MLRAKTHFLIAACLGLVVFATPKGVAQPPPAFAQFEQINTGTNVADGDYFTYTGQYTRTLFFDSFAPNSEKLVDFRFTGGPLAGNSYKATLSFSAVARGNTDSKFINGFKVDEQEFRAVTMSFTNVADGTNLLSVTASTGGLLGFDGGTTADLTETTQAFPGAVINFSTDYDEYKYIETAKKKDYEITFDNLFPGLNVDQNSHLEFFKYAAGAGTFAAAPVPEMSSFYSLGALLLGAPLLMRRKRRQ